MTQDTHKFWVVTKATPNSLLCDILFETDAKGMILQALGGLRPIDVILTTSDVNEAEFIARAELEVARWNSTNA